MFLVLFLFIPLHVISGIKSEKTASKNSEVFALQPFDQHLVQLEGQLPMVINSKVSIEFDGNFTQTSRESDDHIAFLAYFQGNLNTWKISTNNNIFEVNETLCFDPRRNEVPDGKHKIHVTVISNVNFTSVVNLEIYSRVDIELEPDKENTVIFNGLTPKVFLVMPVQNYSGVEYRLKAVTEENSSNCFHISINAFQCPWIDEERLVQNADIHFRMIRKGYFSLVGPKLAEGFVLSVIPMETSESCYSSKKQVAPLPTVNMKIVIENTAVDYLLPLFLPLTFILLVIAVVATIFFTSLRCILHEREGDMETTRDRKKNSGKKQEFSWQERQRSKAFMLVVPLVGGFYAILAIQLVLEYDTDVEKCYKNYGCTMDGYENNLNHTISNIGFFLYGIAYVLLTAIMYKNCGNRFLKKEMQETSEMQSLKETTNENDYAVNTRNLDSEGKDLQETTDENDSAVNTRKLDSQVKNAKCKVYNNAVQEGKGKDIEYGIYKQYSLYHALGFCLVFQGIFSISFHICPSDKSLQIDTLMMTFMLMLVFVKVHQLRHHKGSFNAYFIMWILMFPNLFISIYLHVEDSTRVWVYAAFCVIHILTVSILVIDMYLGTGDLQSVTFYLNLCHVKRQEQEDSDKRKKQKDSDKRQEQKDIIRTKRRKVGFLLLGSIIFISNVLIMVIFSPSFRERGSSNMNEVILFMYSVNLFVIMLYFMGAKVSSLCTDTDDRPGYGNSAEKYMFWTSIIYMVLGFIFCGLAGYFYVNKLQKRGLTPPESRNLNMPCGFLDFYDNHDMWHFFSATGIFLELMAILVIDDNLMLTESEHVEGKRHIFP